MQYGVWEEIIRGSIMGVALTITLTDQPDLVVFSSMRSCFIIREAVAKASGPVPCECTKLNPVIGDGMKIFSKSYQQDYTAHSRIRIPSFALFVW